MTLSSEGMASLPQPEGRGLTDPQAARMVATGLLAPFLYLPGPGESLVRDHGCRSANAPTSADRVLCRALGCASAGGGVTALSLDRSPVPGNSEYRRRGKLFFGSGVSVLLPRGKEQTTLSKRKRS